MRELTAGLVAEFSALSGGDAETALAGFSRRFGGYRDGDFESLIGPLEAVSGALEHLRRLGSLADEAPGQLESALSVTAGFVDTLYRVGFGTALGLIAARAQGAGSEKFEDVILRTCRAIAELDSDSPVVVGTLNYDGLLHAGFLEVATTSGMCDLAAGLEGIEASPDGTTHCLAHPLRYEDDLPERDIQLLNLHGSLSWLADKETRAAWKFELSDLRSMDYWSALKRGSATLFPMVVLTNRKAEMTLQWPFSLAYDVFERRMATSDRWLVAGYRFGDEPVNSALKRAASLRSSMEREPPEVLVVTTTTADSGMRGKVAQALGIPLAQVQVETCRRRLNTGHLSPAENWTVFRSEAQVRTDARVDPATRGGRGVRSAGLG